MRRSIVMCLTALLAGGSVAVASPHYGHEQQTVERPRRIQLGTGGFLGVELGEVNRDTAARLKLRDERGALIEGVTSGSGAAQAGLQKNDVIVKWDGERIDSASEMSRQIRETPAGRSVRLGVIRDGREIEVNVTLGERTSIANRFVVTPATAAPVRIRPERVRSVRIRPEVVVRRLEGRNLGVSLQGMTPQLAEYFGLSKRSGALVIFVFADSPAAKAGLKAGDVILSVGAEQVEGPSDVRRALTDKSDGAVEFKILRDKQEQTLRVQLEKGSGSWLLMPDDSDLAFRLATVPFSVEVPDFKFTPLSIKVPTMNLKPMKIQIPKFNMAPTIPKFKLAPMKVEIPQIKIEPVKIIVPRRVVI